MLGLPGVQLLVELGEQLPDQGHAAVVVAFGVVVGLRLLLAG